MKLRTELVFGTLKIFVCVCVCRKLSRSSEHGWVVDFCLISMSLFRTSHGFLRQLGQNVLLLKWYITCHSKYPSKSFCWKHFQQYLQFFHLLKVINCSWLSSSQSSLESVISAHLDHELELHCKTRR